jgi:hypothetical protein
VVVRDDEDAVADPRSAGGGCEDPGARERMPTAAGHGEIRQLVDPEERRARDVLLEVRLPSRLDAVERVTAVDELVPDQ